jgi:microcystin-dependent protein
MKRYYVSALAALALTSSLYAESPDAYIGSIWATGAKYCPTNTVPADGRLLNINVYPALFALFGTTYGGNGVTMFGVPNLGGRTPVGLTNDLPSSSVVKLGTTRGQERVTLTASNLPPHTHVPTFTPSGSTTPFAVNVAVSSNVGSVNQPSSAVNTLSGSTTGPAGANMWASAPGTPVNLAGVAIANGAGAAKVTLDNAGINTSIPTIPPVLGMTYCVTVNGVYPQQP